MPEWDNIAPYYDCLFSNRQVDVKFWVTLAKRYGSNILEFGCGTGRLTILMARAGTRVVGIDISRPMLKIGEKNLRKEDMVVQKRVKLIEANACSFSLPRERFSAIFSPWGFVPVTDSEQEGLFRSVKKHLIPKGIFVIDCYNYPKFKADNENYQIVNFISTGNYYLLREALSQVKIKKKIIKLNYCFNKIDKKGTIQKIRTRRTERIYTKKDLETLLVNHGFKILALYGDYNLLSWSSKSARTILVSQLIN